jgi:hypothetical protein
MISADDQEAIDQPGRSLRLPGTPTAWALLRIATIICQRSIGYCGYLPRQSEITSSNGPIAIAPRFIARFHGRLRYYQGLAGLVWIARRTLHKSSILSQSPVSHKKRSFSPPPLYSEVT